MSDPVFAMPLRWIRLATYCQLTGDTPDAVHARRRKRQWTDGVHCTVDPGGNLWVNPEEVNRWIEKKPAEAPTHQAAANES